MQSLMKLCLYTKLRINKFQFVGKLKSNRICHGFVAVAFFFGFSRSIFVIRRFESFDVGNGSILTVRHGRGRRILKHASRCSARVCLTAEAVILQAKPQTSPRAERCSAHGFSALQRMPKKKRRQKAISSFL